MVRGHQVVGGDGVGSWGSGAAHVQWFNLMGRQMVPSRKPGGESDVKQESQIAGARLVEQIQM